MEGPKKFKVIVELEFDSLSREEAEWLIKMSYANKPLMGFKR